MNKKVKISAVSYTNTYPFLYGIEKVLERDSYEVSCDVPSECARKLRDNEVDLGLIPVAEIPNIPNAEIVSDYCIGAKGAVKTVLLMSKIPLEDIRSVYLDTESRTSVNLVKILARELWHKSWQFRDLPLDYVENPNVKTMVLIGDKTQKVTNFPYTYDLSEAWFQLTKKPFVFAVWVSNKKIKTEFVTKFNDSLKFGVKHIDESIEKYTSINDFDTKNYLEKYISYPFDTEKKKALKLFLKHLTCVTQKS